MRTLLITTSILALAACGGGDRGTADGGPDLGVHDGGGADGGGADGGVDMGPPPACVDPVIPPLTTMPLVAGYTFDSPTFLTTAPGDSAIYVVERGGTIQVVVGTTVTQFADFSSETNGAGGEQGLLGLAFDPDYATNGRFFIGYSRNSPTLSNVVAQYHRSAGDPHVADPAPDAVLVMTNDPESNHNGGWVGFGPDGFLYATIGDGGSGCDPHGSIGNGQNTNELFGKMLRLDPDNMAGMYAAAGNPFSGGGGLAQIWAYGLRNAWRASFDRATGDLYIGDVGQNSWEEIDYQPASSHGGENYGWRLREGTHSSTDSGCAGGAAPAGAIEPITDYAHSGGRCSVTGGYVYRGSAIPALQGVYLYGDYCSGDIYALRYCDGAAHGPVDVPDLGLGGGLGSFAEDAAGEMYILNVDSGSVRKIVPM